MAFPRNMHFKLLILVLGISRAISKSDVRSHAEAMVAVSANGGMVDHSAVRRVGNSNAGSRAEVLDAAVLRESTPSRRSAEKNGYEAVAVNSTDCIAPNTTGYNFDNFQSAGGNLSVSNFVLAGVECASGYSGSVGSEVCSSAGAVFTLTGCLATCVVPSSTGYNFSNAGGNLTRAGFDATGVSCATGYVGEVTVPYTVCSGPGTPYTVNGCVEVTYLNKGVGEFCEGNPGGVNEGVFATNTSCQANCTANANCVAYDWHSAENYTWCVLATACTVVSDPHAQWTHVEKLTGR